MAYLLAWTVIVVSTLVFKLIGSRVVPDESWFWSAQVLLGLFFLCFMNQGRSRRVEALAIGGSMFL